MLAVCLEVWKVERGRFYQQFGEPSESGQQENAVINPIAANLVRLMEQARQARERRGFTEFYPPFWMYDRIGLVVAEYSPSWRRRVQSEEFQRFAQKEGINIDDINLRSEISDEGLEERQQFFSSIQLAYGIVAYPQFTPCQKNVFREELRETIRISNTGNVNLNEPQRELLTQIAIATKTAIDPDQGMYDFDTVLKQPEITKEEMLENPRYDTW
jgi:hypothetical protein